MSNAAITWAYGQDLKSGPKFILVTLSDYADENNSCYPSIAQLSEKTGISERSVREHLDALERDGLLSRIRTRNSDGTLGRYRFTLHLVPPAAKFARGEKTQEPAAKSAAHNPHITLNTTTTTNAREQIDAALGNSVNPKSHRMLLHHEPIGWTQGENGCDFDLDLLPTIKRLADRAPPHSISSWNYFKTAVFEARDQRIAKPDNPAPNPITRKTNEPDYSKSASHDRATEIALRNLEQRGLDGCFDETGYGGDPNGFG